MMRCSTLILLLGVIATQAPAADGTRTASTNDWLQWRGPHRDGTLDEAVWPDSLGEDALHADWRIDLGPGYSGPIVSGDRVFVTETKDKTYEIVRALERQTGTVLWQTRWRGAMQVPGFARRNGDWIRATPACDGETLFVAGMRDVLVALDVQTGGERWRVDFAERFSSSIPSFGCASSPLLDENHVYMQAGGGFVKLDKATGDTVWRVLADGGGMMSGAFSSPLMSDEVNGSRTLYVQTRADLASIDPESGQVAWQQPIEAFRGMNILTPTVVGQQLFTGAYGGRSLLLQPAGASGSTVTRTWDNKAQPYMSSPVVVDGHIYLHLRNRRFTCIEAATGETKWTTTPFGEYWSMVTDRTKILALDQTGTLYLIRANPEQFEVLDQRAISEAETWGHLAIAGNELFIRELNAVGRYIWETP